MNIRPLLLLITLLVMHIYKPAIASINDNEQDNVTAIAALEYFATPDMKVQDFGNWVDAKQKLVKLHNKGGNMRQVVVHCSDLARWDMYVYDIGLWSAAHAILGQLRLAYSHECPQNAEIARMHFTQASDCTVFQHAPKRWIEGLMGLGDYALHKGVLQQAEGFYLMVAEHGQKLNHELACLKVHQRLEKVYSAQGNHEKAAFHRQQYMPDTQLIQTVAAEIASHNPA